MRNGIEIGVIAAALAIAGAAGAQTVQWRPGITPAELGAAHIVRINPNVRRQDLSALRDDQVIETAAGRHITVARFRAIQHAFELARARTSAPRRQDFPILAPTPRNVPVATLRPHESLSEILSRPDSQVVRLPNGSTATVAQFRAAADHLRPGAGGPRRAIAGPAIRIRSIADLKALPANAPDSTILESPNGRRVTLGEIRQTLKAQNGRITPVRAGRTAQ